MSEAMYSADVLAAMSEAFHVVEQPQGTHWSGRRLRADAILTPRSPIEWADCPGLVVEFKDPEAVRGDTRNYTAWLAQCVDYAQTVWDGHGRLMVFACPSLQGAGMDEFTFTRILGQLGVGELKQLDRYGWTLALHGSHRLWSEARGVEQGRRWRMRPKVGSR